MTQENLPTYEELIKRLQEEGSFKEYYRYLHDRYGTRLTGNIYGYSAQYPTGTPEENPTNHLTKGFLDSATQKFVDVPDDTEVCEGFLRNVIEEDLGKKSLQYIFWVAEAEKEYNKHPYFRAIDIYYKLNLIDNPSKEDVLERTRDFEDMVSYDQWGNEK